MCVYAAAPRDASLQWQEPRALQDLLLVVQSLQAFPRLPHVVSLDFMHLPAWQQPVRQLSALQLPDDPEELPLDEPLDDPEELPLDDPDELPLDDPEELPLDEPVPPAHAPL